MGLKPGEIELLFVGEDTSNFKAIIEMLSQDEHTKFNIEQKTSLKEAREILDSKDCKYDVILLDVILPNSEGIDTYETIRDLCENIPIVIISGFEDIACQCVKRGAQDYILKCDLNAGLIARSLKYAIERKKLETKKLLIENQFKDVMEHTPLGILLYELQGNDLIFVGHNPAANKILGYDNSQNMGKTIEEAYPPLAETEIPDRYRQVVRYGISWEAERVDYDDGMIAGSFRVHAYKVGENRMAASFEDITEKIKIQEVLQETKERYRELVEVTRAAIYEIDIINNKFLYVNDVLCDITGWTKEEFMEMRPTDILTKRSLDHFLSRMDALKSGEFIEPTFEYEVKIKDGSVRWTLITAKFKENEKGIVTSANVVAIDITNQKLAELEAKRKEEIIFGELETRIKSWKDEIAQTSLEQQDRIKSVGANIQSITNGAEVIQ